MSDLVLLPVILLHLGLHQFQPCLHEHVVVAAVSLQYLFLHVHNIVTDTVQKVLAVGDEQQDGGVGLQLLLQPHARLQVEVVGRLVQE